VEGAPLAASRNDACNDRVEISQDFSGGNAESREADFCQSLVPNGIPLGTIAALVCFAIYLDR